MAKKVTTLKSEAAKGNIEYTPSVSIKTVTAPYDKDWEKNLRETLLPSILAYRAINVKKSFPEAVQFNGNMSDPRWNWKEDYLATLYIWRLNDIATVLKNAETLGTLLK